MATCNVNDLLAEAGAIAGLTPGQRRVLIAKLLYDISGSTSTVQELLAEANCLMCLTPAQLRVVQAQLLCNFSGGGGGGGYQPPVATGDIPNDSFEDYTSGEDLAELNGGENGVNPFIINWESVWVSQPWFVDIGTAEPPDTFPSLVQWVKADAIMGVNNNDALGSWLDQSGNGNNFSAAGAQRPTYQTGIQNGLPGVFFNSVAGVGMTGSVNIPTGDFTVMIVLKCNGVAQVGRRAIQGTAGNWSVGLFGAFLLVDDGDQEIAYQQGTTNCHVLVITQTATGTLTKTWVDGGESAYSAAVQVWPGVLSLGATGFSNFPADAWIFEVAVYARVLVPGEILSISLNMIEKWAI